MGTPSESDPSASDPPPGDRVCLPYINPDDPASCSYDPDRAGDASHQGDSIAESPEASAALAVGGLLVGGYLLSKVYRNFE